MKRLVFSIITTVIGILTTNAVVVQRVHLKNGSVLYGYIEQQDKGSNIITFHIDQALICVPGDKYASKTDRQYAVGELDKQWMAWAEKNEAFNGAGNDRTLLLSDVSFKSGNHVNDSVSTSQAEDSYFENAFGKQILSVSKVRVLETGAILRYLQLSPGQYQLKWEDINYIDAERRAKDMLSGIDRTYVLRGGKEVTGQYAGETENTLSLYGQDGMKETYDMDDVDKYLYKGINPNQTLFEQSALLDIVETRQGGKYEGIIVERDFTTGSNHLVIELSPESRQTVKFADIIRYSKKENPGYQPKTDILLKEGQVMINRIAADSVKVSDARGVLVLEENDMIALPAGTREVVIEYYNPQHRAEKLMLVKLQNVGTNKRPVYGFTSNIFSLQSFAAETSEISVNNTSRVKYTLPGAGRYAFFDNDNRQAMPFIIP